VLNTLEQCFQILVLGTHSSAQFVHLPYLTHLIQIIISLRKSSELNWVCQTKETYKMCRAVGPQDQDWEPKCALGAKIGMCESEPYRRTILSRISLLSRCTRRSTQSSISCSAWGTGITTNSLRTILTRSTCRPSRTRVTLRG